MKSITYISRALSDFDDDQLSILAADARVCNEKAGVTGYLFYSRKRFLQYIEGDDRVVDDLMSRIEQDSRHTVVHQTSELSLKQRRFPDWGMSARWIRCDEVARIQLETVIYQHLEFSKRTSASQIDWRNTVTRMLDRLAEVRISENLSSNRFSSGFA
ncbi:MAG: BLUF domain-containing protein [Pseudomonadota bacterium]